MAQKNFIRILAGANRIARKSGESVKESSANYIEQNVLKGKYATREEYQQLQKLVMKLQQELAELKKH